MTNQTDLAWRAMEKNEFINNFTRMTFSSSEKLTMQVTAQVKNLIDVFQMNIVVMNLWTYHVLLREQFRTEYLQVAIDLG